jgi:uncharacterized protein
MRWILLYFHLILTDECNLCCTYCRAKAFEEAVEKDDPSSQVEIDPTLPSDLDVNLERS